MSSAPVSPQPANAPGEALAKLKAFYRKRQLVVDALDRGSDQFETIGPMHPYYGAPIVVKPLALKNEEEIRLACEQLVYYIWHYGEYIKLVAQEERGLTEEQADKLVKRFVEQHTSLRILGYLANVDKHAKLTRKNPADDIQPRYGQIWTMFPEPGGKTYCGVIGFATEVQGTFAGPAIQTVMVEDKDGKYLGHVRHHADRAAEAWVELLEKKLSIKL